MARLRHFAIVVRDLEKAAAFYEGVFDLKRVGQEVLDFASAIYLSDGTINLALLNYVGKRGSGLDNAREFVGAHHFGFQVDDIEAVSDRLAKDGLEEARARPSNRPYAEFRACDPEGNQFDLSQHGFQDVAPAARQKEPVGR